MNRPTVSVIVPVFNAARTLPRLMTSLRAQEYPRERVEVILVDNNSADNSAEVMRVFPHVVALAQTHYQTAGATRNVGIERATGEVMAFIDADCWADQHWLSAGIQTLLEKDLDRVAGRVEFALSSHPNVYEIYDSSVNFGQPDFVSRGWSGTGNLFTRRCLFEQVGLFDPAPISAEDCEFGLRATRAGKTLGYAPDAVVYHRARASLKSLVKKWIRTEYGAAQVYKRHGLLPLHLWNKKANYRPLLGVWRKFPPDVRKNPRLRLAIDGLANILRLAGNLGNFLGYLATKRCAVPPHTRLQPR